MIGHDPWNGCNLADFVMPFFLFIVGMSIALALKRITLAYVVVALIEITTKDAQAKNLSPGHLSIFKLYRRHWVLGACVLIVYLAIIYGAYVPDWQFTIHNPDSVDFGKTQTAFTTSSPSWCWAPFELEGILSSISVILSIVFWACPYTYEATPLNKQLYTLSYICVTSGAAALVFSAFLHSGHAVFKFY
ncbi:hypothetical protein LguiA_030084 [Lonicera macranthoides]